MRQLPYLPLALQAAATSPPPAAREDARPDPDDDELRPRFRGFLRRVANVFERPMRRAPRTPAPKSPSA